MCVADMVLKNAKVFSINFDNIRQSGEAIAVRNGKILKVGTNEDMKVLTGDNTEVVDCDGNTVMPGMCDAHCHPSIALSVQDACDLFGIYREDDIDSEEIINAYMSRLKEYIDKHHEKKLIRGTGWIFHNFSEDRMPTRHDIDKICCDRPVILESFCQHNLWVNSKAIELAGVDENTPDVFAGKIFREENGYPEGVFNDPEAMDMIKSNVEGYDLSVDEYKEGMLYYQRECANKYGVTLVQDCMHSDNAREAYRQLASEGKLTIRLRGVYMTEPAKSSEQLVNFIERKGKDNEGEDFRIDTVKIFSEGAFILDDPYEKSFIEDNGLDDDYNGQWYWEDKQMTQIMTNAMKSGFNVHVHAMGDGAVKQSANCLAKAQKNAGVVNPRNIIAHLMLVKEDDARLMAESEIIANCQPRWMVHDSDIEAMTPMVGKKRASEAYPLRTFLDKGITVAFGTDFPVTPPPDTMHEIHCAVNRSVFPDAHDYEKFKGKILGNEKTATLEEAIKAITINGAYQMFAEGYTGSIEEGKSADIVILDSDIESISPAELYNIKIEKTIFKGNVVYEK